MENWNLMKVWARRVRQDEEGVTALEYGMIAGLIAAVIITTVKTIGTQLEGFFTTITGAL